MRCFCRALVVIFPFLALLSCSTPSPCEVPIGTPEAQVKGKLTNIGYAETGPDGPVRGTFRFCCVGGPLVPLPDGGCGEVCAGQPRVYLYVRDNAGSCEGTDARGGRLLCQAYVMDGEVVSWSEGCVD
jgi:hypothetical protein